MWRRLFADFELDDEAARSILQVACEAADRAREARQQIEADGLVIVDRFGQRKGHPAAAIERDAQGTLVRALRALQLDVDEPTPGQARLAAARAVTATGRFKPGKPPKGYR
ncbi:MAG TPA: P27 family phage terminase small subunit [Usitatibacter sp.]|jgi:phage terminase small subunit|nr:P27 family phage terminase small subunit [Usitatibacter sp.]